jgi:hypothetical protein
LCHRPFASSECAVEIGLALLALIPMKNTTVRVGITGFVKLAALVLLFGNPMQALAAAPACLQLNGTVIPVDNDKVLLWKTSTPNQYLARAHITGIVQKAYANQSGHNHFSIKIGDAATDTIEVIYNISFGALPHIVAGMQVETCGDFINSFAPAGSYPTSPDKAIIHWIHKSDSNNHASGFLTINGVNYGLGNGHGN